MKWTLATDVLDEMIADEAARACRFAATAYGFDEIGAGAGVGIRLRALQDAKQALITAALAWHEEQDTP